MNHFVGSLYRTQDVLGIGGELYFTCPYELLRIVLQGRN